MAHNFSATEEAAALPCIRRGQEGRALRPVLGAEERHGVRNPASWTDRPHLATTANVDCLVGFDDIIRTRKMPPGSAIYPNLQSPCNPNPQNPTSTGQSYHLQYYHSQGHLALETRAMFQIRDLGRGAQRPSTTSSHSPRRGDLTDHTIMSTNRLARQTVMIPTKFTTLTRI